MAALARAFGPHAPDATVDETSGALMGAIADSQVQRVRQLVTEAGNAFDYASFPTMPHAMHAHGPSLYVDTLVGWARGLTG